jgi:phenylalanyl-tRNA synthetase alpha chain
MTTKRHVVTDHTRYNPYTEPSMEIFSYHKGLNKLIEIGNSGIFRPEMLEVCVNPWRLFPQSS